MPRSSAKRNCSVVVYDFNTGNQEQAKNAVLKIFADKYFRLSRDVTKVFFMNVNKNHNKHASDYTYRGIYEATDVVFYDPQTFANIFDKGFEKGESDWVAALGLAVDSMKSDFQGVNNVYGIITKQILFISDLNFPHPTAHPDMLKSIITDIGDFDMFLYFVGPEIKFTHTITSISDLKAAMKQFTLKVDDGTANLVKRLVSETKHTVVCDYKIGTEMFSVYTRHIRRQPWQMPLTFGTRLQVPTSTFRLLNKKANFVLHEDKSQNPEKVVWLDAEDGTTEIHPKDVVPGVNLHGKFIAIDSVVGKTLKCATPKRFSLVCFTHQSSIPEYLMLGDGTRIVVPDITRPQYKNIASALIDRLYEKKLYAIALQAYNINNKPKYMVLIPKPDYIPKCFFMVQLPFAYESTLKYEESTPTDLEDGVSDEVSGFLDSLDIHGPKCQIQLPLTANLIQTVCDSKIMSKALEKRIGKKVDLDSVTEDIFDFANAREPLENLKNVMPEMRIVDEVNLDNANNMSDTECDFNDEI